MPLQNSTVQAEADAIANIANRTAKLLADLHKVLEHNSDLAIDWGAGSTPAYITEEANGNLSGRTFTRQEVANAIGSLDWVRKLLTNQTMTGSQGDHLGNLNKLAAPLG
jgi:SAM-dependent MidA family methyltransferase